MQQQGHTTRGRTIPNATLDLGWPQLDGCKAATGQGKTLTFVWPVAVHCAAQTPLTDQETGFMAPVLAPTQELGLQAHKQAKPILAAVQATSSAVIGGQSKHTFQQELKKMGGAHLVVATPGRLLDVLSD